MSRSVIVSMTIRDISQFWEETMRVGGAKECIDMIGVGNQ